MDNSTLRGRGITLEAQFRALDALPSALRQVYARAPYDYHMGSVLRRYQKSVKAGLPLEVIRRDLVDNILIDVSANVARDYGRDHPQFAEPARGHPLEAIAARVRGGG